LIAGWWLLLVARRRRLVARWWALLVAGWWALLVAGWWALLVARWWALLVAGWRTLVSRWRALLRWRLVAGRRWVGAGRRRSGLLWPGGGVAGTTCLAGLSLGGWRFVRRGRPPGGWLGHYGPPGGYGRAWLSARCGQPA
jgi:hypothetical protein